MWIKHKIKDWISGPERVRIISEQAGLIVEIDCTTAVSPVFSNTVTTQKTEDKKDLTGNIIVNALDLKISGIIGNKDPHDLSEDMAGSLGMSLAFEAGNAMFPGAGSLAAGLTGTLTEEKPGNRAAEICGNIVRFQSERHLLTISTRCFVFPNMVIKSFSPGQSTEHGRNLSFTLELAEVRWVTTTDTKTRLIKAKTPAAKKSAIKSSKKQEMGLQPTTEPVQSTKSAAMNLLNKIRGS